MWYVYGVVPETGKPWRVTSDEGFGAIPLIGMVKVWEPGRRHLQNGSWYMYRSDVDEWIEAEDACSALEKHALFPCISCTRKGYYARDEEWLAALALCDADVEASRG